MSRRARAVGRSSSTRRSTAERRAALLSPPCCPAAAAANAGTASCACRTSRVMGSRTTSSSTSPSSDASSCPSASYRTLPFAGGGTLGWQGGLSAPAICWFRVVLDEGGGYTVVVGFLLRSRLWALEATLKPALEDVGIALAFSCAFVVASRAGLSLSCSDGKRSSISLRTRGWALIIRFPFLRSFCLRLDSGRSSTCS